LALFFPQGNFLIEIREFLGDLGEIAVMDMQLQGLLLE
jgi:hypothetical protein